MSAITPSKEQIRAATLAKIAKAQQHIEAAQNQLDSARSELSALMYGAPAWKACGALRERVHAFWYRVGDLRGMKRVTLDATNIERLARAIEAAQQPSP